MPAVDEFVAVQNIRNFEAQLTKEIEPTEREMLTRLLTEERAKLTAIWANNKNKNSN